MFKFFTFLICLCLLDFSYCKTTNSVEFPLKIGAFNVQKLGNSKLGNEEVMKVVKRVLLRYDLVLLQEIVTTDSSLMNSLLKDLNKESTAGETYMMAISERLGRDRAKEQYAFLYKSEKLQFLGGLAYPDPEDKFMRPPYMVHFSTPTLRDITSIVTIGIHTQPKNAANETSALAECYDYAAKLFKQKNAILMGDMNAGCSNVRVSDWDSIELWIREEFTWLISHDMDTTLSSNCCPYDRFVTAGNEMEDAVIWSSINVFNFRDAYGLTTEKALQVSDHFPIEVELRGKVSKEVKEHLKTSICVTVEDDRPNAIPQEIQQQRTTMGFKIDRSSETTTLYIEGEDSDSLLNSLKKLGAKYSQFVSKELISTTNYKVHSGALEDVSSHEPPETVSFSVLISYDNDDMKTTLHFCADTSVN